MCLTAVEVAECDVVACLTAVVGVEGAELTPSLASSLSSCSFRCFTASTGPRDDLLKRCIACDRQAASWGETMHCVTGGRDKAELMHSSILQREA